jgi:2-C-methyl-D-erythritol 4-phosphate cytidylyltransferase
VIQNKTTAIIPAAGHSTRMGCDKVCLELDGVPVIVRTCQTLAAVPAIHSLVIAVDPVRVESIRELLVQIWRIPKIHAIVAGGENRTASVENALSHVPATARLIAVHDCARPCISTTIIEKAISIADKYGAAVVAHRITDTVKMTDENDCILSTLDRRYVWRAATPQVIRKELFIRAYANYHACSSDQSITDDVQLVELLGEKVVCIESNSENIKLTTPEDREYAEAYFRAIRQ